MNDFGGCIELNESVIKHEQMVSVRHSGMTSSNKLFSASRRVFAPLATARFQSLFQQREID